LGFAAGDSNLYRRVGNNPVACRSFEASAATGQVVPSGDSEAGAASTSGGAEGEALKPPDITEEGGNTPLAPGQGLFPAPPDYKLTTMRGKTITPTQLPRIPNPGVDVGVAPGNYFYCPARV